MTGGGSIESVQQLPVSEAGFVIAHEGLLLHCDLSVMPNTLQVTWGRNNGFHLNTVLTDSCDGTATKSPTSSFNRIMGSGLGRLRVAGQTMTGYATWDFEDNNEPGSAIVGGDAETIFIYEYDSTTNTIGPEVLETCPCPLQGNLQAHDQSS
jgi:hypothetical protein